MLRLFTFVKKILIIIICALSFVNNNLLYVTLIRAHKLLQLHMTLRKLVAGNYETEEKKSIAEFQKNMNILEENVEIIFPCDVPSCGQDMGMLDMLLSTLPNVIYAIEEALNVRLMEPKKYQSTFSRMEALSRLAVVKNTAPPHEKLVRFFRAYRHYYCDKK